MFSFSSLFQSWDVKGGFLVTNASMARLVAKSAVFSWDFLTSSGVKVGFEEAALPAVKWKGWTGGAMPKETDLLFCT